MSERIVVITPCRDEASYLLGTIETMAAQTVRPTAWVIVDDGSTDGTDAILDEAQRRHEFIRVVRRDDRGHRAVGPGVVDAFYAGLESVDLDKFDFVCKLDADLEIPPHYFERMMERFRADPRLGNCSGKAYIAYGDRLVHERRGDENAIGPAKLYRVACFREIGGFVRHAGWDGIDGHRCRQHGWIAESFDEPGVRLVHRRRTGSSQQSFWTGRTRWGAGKWFMGSAWYYLLAVGLYRMLERPYVVSGIGILWGYLAAMLRRKERYDDLEFRRFLRRYELRSLLLGKRRTLARHNARMRKARRVLAVSSGGGHWVQLQRVIRAFDDCDVHFCTVSRAYESDTRGRPLHVISDATRWNRIGVLRLAAQVLKVVWKVRPDVVITTGAAPGYFALRFGRRFGAKTIWLDSMANVETLSMAGTMAGRYADLWLTQWPHLASTDGPEHAGAVM